MTASSLELAQRRTAVVFAAIACDLTAAKRARSAVALV
jgi:hypothetical protein